jgi:hypothetical protein
MGCHIVKCMLQPYVIDKPRCCLQDVLDFAVDMLSCANSPAVVDQSIASRHGKGLFRTPSANERLRPTLNELQQLKYHVTHDLWMEANSWDDLMAKLQALESRPDVHVVWEDYAPDHVDPLKQNFKCFIQHKEQAQWMREHCTDILFVDSTHGTNNYGMQLFIGATQHEGGMTLPLFFFMCTVMPNTKYQMQNGVEWMFQQLHEQHPTFNPHAVMMDHDLSEHNAVAAHFITRARAGLLELQASLQAGEQVAPPPLGAWVGGGGRGSADTPYLDCVQLMAMLGAAVQVGDAELADAIVGMLPPLPPSVVPGTAAYCDMLMEDVQELLQHLGTIVLHVQKREQQQHMWLVFSDISTKFCQRHGLGGPAVSVFCEQYLGTAKLLCEFHTKKAWKEKVNRVVKDPDHRYQIYGQVEKLMKESKNWCTDVFLEPVNAFVAMWDGVYPELMAYFNDNYFCPEWRDAWVAAGRMFKHGGANTNLPLERVNGVLKYMQLWV